MEIEHLISVAAGDELVAIASVLTRIGERPAVIVTVKGGRTARRYVVAVEDEHLFEGLAGVLRPESRPQACDSELDERFGHMGAILASFGAQWLRRIGVVDEMYRSLSLCEVTKVERIDRARVWGR